MATEELRLFFSRTVEDLHKMNKDAHTFGISRSRQEY